MMKSIMKSLITYINDSVYFFDVYPFTMKYIYISNLTNKF